MPVQILPARNSFIWPPPLRSVCTSVFRRFTRPGARSGVGASLTLNEFPGRQFHGTIVRNAESIDQASRTLLVEVDVKNPTGELLPGSYVSVHLKLPSKVRAVTVPVSALLFRRTASKLRLCGMGKPPWFRL